MTREQIKAQVATEQGLSNLTFNFVRQFDERVLTEGEKDIVVKDPKDPNSTITVSFDPKNPDQKWEVKSPWLSHWENTKRVRVVLHENVLKTIKSDPTINTLSFKKAEETAKSSGLPFTRYTIITPANIEASW